MKTPEMFYSALRTALFQLDAETAHHLTINSFKQLPRAATWCFREPVVEDPFECMGLRFRNRVGLAAGLDKNGECLDAWAQLGFGFVEVGTVTPRPQPGNPKPRMFRLPAHGALINRLGFNNDGVDALVKNIQRADYRGVLGINIGKNADTPIEAAADDYRICLEKVYAHASYITVNISSPNTANLRSLQTEGPLAALLASVNDTRAHLAHQHGRKVPVLIKIAPDMDADAVIRVAQTVQSSGMDGLIATNTTISRAAVAGARHAEETGGLSGRPLTAISCEVVRLARAAVGPDFPIVGVGGIDDAESGRARIAAGASLLQIYTGFIYRGPALVRVLGETVAALRKNY